MADKRWCEQCGRSDWAGPDSTVKWWLFEGAVEISLCRVCKDALVADGLDFEVIS